MSFGCTPPPQDSCTKLQGQGKGSPPGQGERTLSVGSSRFHTGRQEESAWHFLSTLGDKLHKRTNAAATSLEKHDDEELRLLMDENLSE